MYFNYGNYCQTHIHLQTYISQSQRENIIIYIDVYIVNNQQRTGTRGEYILPSYHVCFNTYLRRNPRTYFMVNKNIFYE